MPEIRNFPILADPSTASNLIMGNQGAIYVGNQPQMAQIFGPGGTGENGSVIYLGPMAGYWGWAYAGVDGTLIQQAKGIAGIQVARWKGEGGGLNDLGFDPIFTQYHKDSSQTMPWNYGAVLHRGDGWWTPLGPSGSLEVSVAGAQASYWGVDPMTPIYKLSAGYEVTHEGTPATDANGYTTVQVSYRRTGAVPAPGAPIEYRDPVAELPWLPEMVAAMAGPYAVHPGSGLIPASAPVTPSYTPPIMTPNPDPLAGLFVNNGATVAGGPAGPVTPAGSVPFVNAPLPSTGVTLPAPTVVTNTGLEAITGPLASIFGPSAGPGGAAGGGTNWVPLLLVAGVIFLATRK